ncbi:protein-glutamate methylesterase/protein-glutamine glutaminase [Marinicrinis sediminis]|uniref:Protein-glutamate methylesterase/protein-glutamine glutaminase n=1 Tax=Marinicrinis sediminis TaxID=1652465 RepID=A0ABW5R548_9BACL
MKQYKVMVVDDSAFMRKIISDLINEDPQFNVIYTAKNGREAIEQTKLLQPDVITMDVQMPEMDGIEALKIIMDEHPVPVVMLSSVTNEGAETTIQALEMGAVDFVQKPSGSISLDLYKVKQTLIEKLKIAAMNSSAASEKSHASSPNAAPLVQRLTRFSKEMAYERSVRSQEATPDKAVRSVSTTFQKIVAIGTSTGGPKALQEVLSHIPGDFPAPIVIVQHMPPKFTLSLAQRLNSSCAIQVYEAEDQTKLLPGCAYIAPGGYHMSIQKRGKQDYRTVITREEPRMGHRPSVDILFESLRPLTELEQYVVLMTGMGSDGAKGMKTLKEHGAKATLAESEETCIVYGMPRSAVELNGVDHLLPLYAIAPKLVELVGST